MFKTLFNHLRYKQFDHIDVDSVERLEAHREIVNNKKFLYRAYEDFYKTFTSVLHKLPEGPRVELGSGWSFLQKFIPGLIQTDIALLPGMKIRMNAMQISFADQSVAGIFLTNTLHHLPRAQDFFSEVQRVLKPGGYLVLMEPHYSAWSSFIWRVFHHESYTREGPWEFEFTGPLSSANLALTWMVFNRDLKEFQSLYPKLKIVSQKSHTGFAYLLSGGLSMPSLLPGFSYPVIRQMDRIFSCLTGGLTDNFETIILVRQ